MSKKKTPIGLKIKELREQIGLSQSQLAEEMHCNPSYISRIERGQMPSRMFIDFFICKFGLDAEAFLSDVAIHESLEQKSKKYFGPFLAAISLSAPALPLVAGVAATGVGISTLLLRLCDAYQVRTDSALAKRMGIGRNTISRWKDKAVIPKKYLLQAAEQTKRPLAWLLGQEASENRSNVENALRKLDKMIAEGNYSLIPEKKYKVIAFLVEEIVNKGEIKDEKIQDLIDMASR